MCTGIIGYCDIDPGVPLFSLLHEIRDVPRYMRSRLHEKRYDHDIIRPLLDACFHCFRKRRLNILQERVLDDIIFAEFFHLCSNSSENIVRACVFAPMSEDYDSGLHED